MVTTKSIEYWDGMLAMLAMRGVASVSFTEAGDLMHVTFKGGGFQGPNIAQIMREAPIAPPSVGAANALGVQGGYERKDSLLDLALNPPNDVRFPTDVGEDSSE